MPIRHCSQIVVPHATQNASACCGLVWSLVRVLACLLLTISGIALCSPASAAIAFVQVNSSDPETPETTVAVSFSSAQTAGNLNIVAIGWSDSTNQVESVTDSAGNTYVQAGSPAVLTEGARSEATYYAKNIVSAPAGGNMVTVTFTGAAAFADVRVFEYSGLDTTSPLDGTANGTGTSSSLATGSISTANANDLLFYANDVETYITSDGPGYTQRLLSAHGGSAADRIVTSTGSYSATAAQADSGQWAMQVVAFKAAASGGGGGGAGSAAFVQVNSSDPETPETTVSASFPSAQTAGNLNIVAIGWSDSTNQVESVTDSAGNTYVQAGSPAVLSGGARSEATYYAKNIVGASAGANRVTVTFTGAAPSADLRVFEYSGLNTTNPLDGTAGGTGTSSSLATSSISTTNANDLLFYANDVETYITSDGPGYTQRLLSADGGSAADRIVTSTGSYSATAAQADSGQWAIQIVAFKIAGSGGGGDTQPPSSPTNLTATASSSTQINLSWTASTDNVGVTGYDIERCQGSGCSSFVQIGTSSTPSYTDSGLSASTSYTYRVRATDAAGNLSGYSSTAAATTTAGLVAPSGLIVVAAASSEIDLAWSGSTGGGGTISYLLERCSGVSCSSFAQVGAPSGTSYNSTSLNASQSYSYRVRATDPQGDLSPYSNTVSYTTPAATPDCSK